MAVDVSPTMEKSEYLCCQEYHIFNDWKTLDRSQTKFCGTPGPNSLKLIKLTNRIPEYI
jgi:hypothetical protein